MHVVLSLCRGFNGTKRSQAGNIETMRNRTTSGYTLTNNNKKHTGKKRMVVRVAEMVTTEEKAVEAQPHQQIQQGVEVTSGG